MRNADGYIRLRHRKPVRAVALCLVVTSFAQEIGLAGIDLGSKAEVQPKSFSLPQNIGIVKEAASGANSEVIINIKDIHDNFSAQGSITQILENLVANYDVKTIGIEGAFGEVDTSLLASLPDRAMRKNTADFLMKEGRLSAGEFFSAMNDQNIAIYGMDDEKLYEENLAAFNECLKNKENVFPKIITLWKALEGLQTAVYSKELLELEKNGILVSEGSLKFSERWETISGLADRYGIRYLAYPNIKTLLQSVATEKKIDFKAAQAQRDALLEKIGKALPREKYEKLIEQSIAYKLGRISQGSFSTYLLNVATDTGVDVNRFADLKKYADYMLLYESLDIDSLKEELLEVEEKIREKLYRNQDERDLHGVIRDVGILKDILEVKLSSESLRYFKAHEAEFNPDRFSSWIKKISNKYGVQTPPFDIAGIFAALPGFLHFYESAEKRNQALLANTIKRMRDRGERVACLVTGGFHSRGITELLKDQDMSYLVILPRFNKKSTRPYLTIVTNQAASYKEFVQSKQVIETKRRMTAHYFSQVAFKAIKDKANVSRERKNELIRKAVDQAKVEYRKNFGSGKAAPGVILANTSQDVPRSTGSVNADTIAQKPLVVGEMVDLNTLQVTYTSSNVFEVSITGSDRQSLDSYTVTFTADGSASVESRTTGFQTNTTITTDSIERGADNNTARLESIRQEFNTLTATGNVANFATSLGDLVSQQKALQSRDGESSQAVRNRAEVFATMAFVVANNKVFQTPQVASLMMQLDNTCSICHQEVVEMNVKTPESRGDSRFDLPVFMVTMQTLAQNQVYTATFSQTEILAEDLIRQITESASVSPTNTTSPLATPQAREAIEALRRAVAEKDPLKYYEAFTSFYAIYLQGGEISMGSSNLNRLVREEISRLREWKAGYDALDTVMKSLPESLGTTPNPQSLTLFLNRLVGLSGFTLSRDYDKAEKVFFEAMFDLLDTDSQIDFAIFNSGMNSLSISPENAKPLLDALQKSIAPFARRLIEYGTRLTQDLSVQSGAAAQTRLEAYSNKLDGLQRERGAGGLRSRRSEFLASAEELFTSPEMKSLIQEMKAEADKPGIKGLNRKYARLFLKFIETKGLHQTTKPEFDRQLADEKASIATYFAKVQKDVVKGIGITANGVEDLRDALDSDAGGEFWVQEKTYGELSRQAVYEFLNELDQKNMTALLANSSDKDAREFRRKFEEEKKSREAAGNKSLFIKVGDNRYFIEVIDLVMKQRFKQEDDLEKLEADLETLENSRANYSEDQLALEVEKARLEYDIAQARSALKMSVDLIGARKGVETALANAKSQGVDNVKLRAFLAKYYELDEKKFEAVAERVEEGKLVTGDDEKGGNDFGALEMLQKVAVESRQLALKDKPSLAERMNFDNFRNGRLTFKETIPVNQKAYFLMRRLLQMSEKRTKLAQALDNREISKIPELFAELDEDGKSNEEENLLTAYIFNRATGMYFMNKQLVGLAKIRDFNLAAGTGTGKTFIEFAAAAQQIIRMLNGRNEKFRNNPKAHTRDDAQAVFINVPNLALVEQFMLNPHHIRFVEMMTGGNGETRLVRGKQELLDVIQSEHDEEKVMKELRQPNIVIIDMQSAGFLRQSSRTLGNVVSEHLETTVEYIDEGDALYTNLSDYVGSMGEKAPEDLTPAEKEKVEILKRRREQAINQNETRIKVAGLLTQGLDLGRDRTPKLLTLRDYDGKTVQVMGWEGANVTVVTDLKYFQRNYTSKDTRLVYLNKDREVLVNHAVQEFFAKKDPSLRDGSLSDDDKAFRLDGLDRGHLQTVVAVALLPARELDGFRHITYIKDKFQYVFVAPGQLRTNQIPGDLQLLQALNDRRMKVSQDPESKKTYDFAPSFDKVTVLDTSGGVSGFELFRKKDMARVKRLNELKKALEIAQKADSRFKRLSESAKAQWNAQWEAQWDKDVWAKEEPRLITARWRRDNEAFLRMGSATQGEVVEFGVLMQGVGVYDVDTFSAVKEGVSFDIWSALQKKMMEETQDPTKFVVEIDGKNLGWSERFITLEHSTFEEKLTYLKELVDSFLANTEGVRYSSDGEHVKDGKKISHEKGQVIDTSSLLINFSELDDALKDALHAHLIAKGQGVVDVIDEINGRNTDGAHHVEEATQKVKGHRRIIFTDLVGTRGNDFQADLMIVNMSQRMSGGELMQLFGRGGRSNEKRGGNFDVAWVNVIDRNNVSAIVDEFFHMKDSVLKFMASPYFNKQTRDLYEKIGAMNSKQEVMDYLMKTDPDSRARAMIFQSEWNLMQKKTQAMMRLWTAGLMYTAVTRYINEALKILRVDPVGNANMIERLEGMNNEIFMKEGNTSSTEHVWLSNQAQSSGSIAQTAFKGVVMRAQDLLKRFVGSESEMQTNNDEVKALLRQARNDVERMSSMELDNLEAPGENSHAGNAENFEQMAKLHKKFETAFAPSHTTNQKPVQEIAELSNSQREAYQKAVASASEIEDFDSLSLNEKISLAERRLESQAYKENSPLAYRARFTSFSMPPEDQTPNNEQLQMIRELAASQYFQENFESISRVVLSHALTRYHSGASYKEEMEAAMAMLTRLENADLFAARITKQILRLMQRNDSQAGHLMDELRNALNDHFEKQGMGFYIYTRMTGENTNLMSVYLNLGRERRSLNRGKKGRRDVDALFLDRIDGLPDELSASINVAESLGTGNFVPIYVDKIRDNVRDQMMDKATGFTESFLTDMMDDYDFIVSEQSRMREASKKSGDFLDAQDLFEIRGPKTGVHVTSDGAIAYNWKENGGKAIEDQVQTDNGNGLDAYQLSRLSRKKGESLEGLVGQINQAAISARDKKTKKDKDDKTLDREAISNKVKFLIGDSKFRQELFAEIIPNFTELSLSKDRRGLLEAITKAEVRMLTTHEFGHELHRLLVGNEHYGATKGGDKEFIAHLASTLGDYGLMALEQIYGYHSMAPNTDGWKENYKIPTLKMLHTLAKKFDLEHNFTENVEDFDSSESAKDSNLAEMRKLMFEIVKIYKGTRSYKDKDGNVRTGNKAYRDVVVEILKEEGVRLGEDQELNFSTLRIDSEGAEGASSEVPYELVMPTHEETAQTQALADNLVPVISEVLKKELSQGTSSSPKDQRILRILGLPPGDDDEDEKKRQQIYHSMALTAAERINSLGMDSKDFEHQFTHAIQALKEMDDEIDPNISFEGVAARVDSKISEFLKKNAIEKKQVTLAGAVLAFRSGIDVDDPIRRVKMDLIRNMLGVVVVGADSPDLVEVQLIKAALKLNAPTRAESLFAWAYREVAGQQLLSRDYANYFSRTGGTSPLASEIRAVESRALDKSISDTNLATAYFTGVDVMKDVQAGEKVYDELSKRMIEAAVHPALNKAFKKKLLKNEGLTDILRQAKSMMVGYPENPVAALAKTAAYLNEEHNKWNEARANIPASMRGQNPIPRADTIHFSLDPKADDESNEKGKSLEYWAQQLSEVVKNAPDASTRLSQLIEKMEIGTQKIQLNTNELTWNELTEKLRKIPADSMRQISFIIDRSDGLLMVEVVSGHAEFSRALGETKFESIPAAVYQPGAKLEFHPVNPDAAYVDNQLREIVQQEIAALDKEIAELEQNPPSTMEDFFKLHQQKQNLAYVKARLVAYNYDEAIDKVLANIYHQSTSPSRAFLEIRADILTLKQALRFVDRAYMKGRIFINAADTAQTAVNRMVEKARNKAIEIGAPPSDLELLSDDNRPVLKDRLLAIDKDQWSRLTVAVPDEKGRIRYQSVSEDVKEITIWGAGIVLLPADNTITENQLTGLLIHEAGHLFPDFNDKTLREGLTEWRAREMLRELRGDSAVREYTAIVVSGAEEGLYADEVASAKQQYGDGKLDPALIDLARFTGNPDYLRQDAQKAVARKRKAPSALAIKKEIIHKFTDIYSPYTSVSDIAQFAIEKKISQEKIYDTLLGPHDGPRVATRAAKIQEEIPKPLSTVGYLLNKEYDPFRRGFSENEIKGMANSEELVKAGIFHVARDGEEKIWALNPEKNLADILNALKHNTEKLKTFFNLFEDDEAVSILLAESAKKLVRAHASERHARNLMDAARKVLRVDKGATAGQVVEKVIEALHQQLSLSMETTVLKIVLYSNFDFERISLFFQERGAYEELGDYLAQALIENKDSDAEINDVISAVATLLEQLKTSNQPLTKAQLDAAINPVLNDDQPKAKISEAPPVLPQPEAIASGQLKLNDPLVPGQKLEAITIPALNQDQPQAQVSRPEPSARDQAFERITRVQRDFLAGSSGDSKGMPSEEINLFLSDAVILLRAEGKGRLPLIDGWQITNLLFQVLAQAETEGRIQNNPEIASTLTAIVAFYENYQGPSGKDIRHLIEFKRMISVIVGSTGARLASTQNRPEVLAVVVVPNRIEAEELINTLQSQFPSVRLAAASTRQEAENLLKLSAGDDSEKIIIDINPILGPSFAAQVSDALRRVLQAAGEGQSQVQFLEGVGRQFSGQTDTQIAARLAQMPDSQLEGLMTAARLAIGEETLEPVIWNDILQQTYTTRFSKLAAGLLENRAYAPHVNILPASNAFLPGQEQINSSYLRTISNLPLKGAVYFYSYDKAEVSALRAQLNAAGMSSFKVVDISGTSQEDLVESLKGAIENPGGLPLTILMNRDEIKFENLKSSEINQGTSNRFIIIPKGVTSLQALGLTLIAPLKKESVIYVRANGSDQIPEAISKKYWWLLKITLPLQIFEELRQAITNLRQTAVAA